LVVDDERSMRQVIYQMLQYAGYDCLIAANGSSALELMRDNPIDVVITDIVMPGINGIELTQRIKKEFNADVIVITGYAKDYSFGQIIEKGASDFIKKPIRANELIVRLKRVLRERAVLEDRNRAEKALIASESQLRALATRMKEMEEDLRKELARELHDRVGQNLTALSINLNVLKNYLSCESIGKTKRILDESMELVVETAEHIRDVMARLRPVGLDDYGLVAAINWYGERFSARTGMVVKIHVEGYTNRLPISLETGFFRIAQEAFTNIAKHAQANNVIVTLKDFDGRVRFTIFDDGKGFDANIIHIPGKDTGWGIVSMKERARALNGIFRVNSEPGKGTTVLVEVER